MNPLFHELFQTTRFLTKELNEELHKHGLFHSQWSILYCLLTQGPMGITAISNYFNVEAPTISRTVSRLEQLGWVVRMEGEDKREKIVSLSEKSETELKGISESVIRFEQGVSERISEQEQQILRDLLSKLLIER